MPFANKLNLITTNEVIGTNKSVIDYHNKKHGTHEAHNIISKGGLDGCINAIFYMSSGIYLNAPIEKMAGLLLYRITQGHYFEQGNKRTAVMAVTYFLYNNGLGFDPDLKKVKDLTWGFNPPLNDSSTAPKFKEQDAIEFIEKNIYELPIKPQSKKIIKLKY